MSYATIADSIKEIAERMTAQEAERVAKEDAQAREAFLATLRPELVRSSNATTSARRKSAQPKLTAAELRALIRRSRGTPYEPLVSRLVNKCSIANAAFQQTPDRAR